MNEHETSADIIADMRGGPIPQHRHDRVLLCHYADRFEAALKRETQKPRRNYVGMRFDRMPAEQVLRIGRDFQNKDGYYRGAHFDTVKLLCDTIEYLQEDIDNMRDKPCEEGGAK